MRLWGILDHGAARHVRPSSEARICEAALLFLRFLGSGLQNTQLPRTLATSVPTEPGPALEQPQGPERPQGKPSLL